jgi:hypothetical protein
MTGIDYRREWNLIRQSEASLKAHVQQRVRELQKIYPDAIAMGEVRMKELSRDWVHSMSAETLICLIERVEEWSASQQPYIQAEINIKL